MSLSHWKYKIIAEGHFKYLAVLPAGRPVAFAMREEVFAFLYKAPRYLTARAFVQADAETTPVDLPSVVVNLSDLHVLAHTSTLSEAWEWIHKIRLTGPVGVYVLIATKIPYVNQPLYPAAG